MNEHVDDEGSFQIKISTARKNYYNHNITVHTVPSCVIVLPGETAGDYISAPSKTHLTSPIATSILLAISLTRAMS